MIAEEPRVDATQVTELAQSLEARAKALRNKIGSL